MTSLGRHVAKLRLITSVKMQCAVECRVIPRPLRSIPQLFQVLHLCKTSGLQESQSTGQCAANVPQPFHSSPFSHRICIAPPPRAVASLAAKRPVLCRWYVPRHPKLCRLLQGHSPSLPFAPLLSEVLHSSTPLRPCDKDEGGCGEPIPTTHVLDKAPRLFTVGTSFLDHDMESY